MARNKKQQNLDFADVEALTYDAMRQHGHLPPMTTEDVELLEAELDEIELPFGPSDPATLLRRLEAGVRRTVVLPFDANKSEAARNLACAAREGGEVSAEIKERMAKDKAQHEQRRVEE